MQETDTKEEDGVRMMENGAGGQEEKKGGGNQEEEDLSQPKPTMDGASNSITTHRSTTAHRSTSPENYKTSKLEPVSFRK